jgi:hypothetical protein
VIVMGGGQIILDGSSREVLAATEALAVSDVEPPQIMRLARGLGMAERPLRVEEFVSTLAQGITLSRAEILSGWFVDCVHLGEQAFDLIFVQGL